MKLPDIKEIKKFTGDITADHMQFVDCFVSENVAMFMPIAGPCLLAITPMHTHPAYMFVVNFTENISIVLEEGQFKSQPNTVFSLSPMIPHHEVSEVAIPRYVAIMVMSEFLHQHAEIYKKAPELNKHWGFPASDELLLLIKRFISESKSKKAGSDILLNAISIEVVHLLLRSTFGIQPENNEFASRVEINRCIEYMRQNLSEKHTLLTLACYSGMSVSHFTRVFRNETGSSPIDYLIDMRLEVARRKLIGHSVPLKQIAVDCGFSSPAHFSSSFQKKFKISPSEYLQLK